MSTPHPTSPPREVLLVVHTGRAENAEPAKRVAARLTAAGIGLRVLVEETEDLALPSVLGAHPVDASTAAAAGAEPTLYAATEAEPGSYTGPQWPGEFRGRPGPAAVSRLADDVDLASLLWDLSEEWTGAPFAW